MQNTAAYSTPTNVVKGKSYGTAYDDSILRNKYVIAKKSKGK